MRTFEARTTPTNRPKVEPRAPHVATGAVVAAQGSPEAQVLYAAFAECNALYFADKLAAPLIQITACQAARTWGDYIERDPQGLDSRIRIAPKTARRGELFMLDVLLHEMIHAWQVEVYGDGEDGYRGHGPAFAGECNRIGEALGLPPVGVKGRDGLPDCAHWPMCVRPEGYYPEAYNVPTRRDKTPEPAPEQDEGEGEEEAPAGALERLLRLIEALDDASARRLHKVLGERLSKPRRK